MDEIDPFETDDAPDEAPPDILQQADDLSAGSEETYHERKKETPARIDYRDDPILGGFAKAWIAWRAVETELLSENGSFSLAHTLEATSDIDCALQLVKRFYYRQARICLRTFIEDLVYPLYFFHHRSAFEEWKAGTGQLPTMRGKNGILDSLVQQNELDAGVAARLDKIHKAGNSSVHGAAATMIHAGIHRREWRGHSFKAAELEAWLATAKECLECGICVVKRISDDWLAATQNGPHFCRRCHSQKFTAKKYEYRPWVPVHIDLGGVKVTLPEPEGPRPDLYIFECSGCGAVWHGTNPTKGLGP